MVINGYRIHQRFLVQSLLHIFIQLLSYFPTTKKTNCSNRNKTNFEEKKLARGLTSKIIFYYLLANKLLLCLFYSYNRSQFSTSDVMFIVALRHTIRRKYRFASDSRRNVCNAPPPLQPDTTGFGRFLMSQNAEALEKPNIKVCHSTSIFAKNIKRNKGLCNKYGPMSCLQIIREFYFWLQSYWLLSFFYTKWLFTSFQIKYGLAYIFSQKYINSAVFSSF